mmetsp:Transcript_14599/g.16131  ORF Transcript_14599/g.16131 Transcript_14599/m.16131 type:complete len:516 (+) Transcript_14599:59-1606(+)|eukprot:CAMPEP_0114995628 /NCGR_PEP_ID=MMETSP0216-20121206/13839_1 /TAXON_ID=223996 /ORGANISM="Protocruzia adherens, Strain Boccale" /LENGTH=515 /DNA_ID=CAMNT_0002359699 /DNA_START=83 /DNA_END=1630 /DNA_ORIENTATION=+
MSSNFPKLPGFVSTHDPTLTNFKKISANKQEGNRDTKNKSNLMYGLPRQTKVVQNKPDSTLRAKMQTTSGSTFVGNDATDQFEPNWVKLDRAVLRFQGYFKEAVVESATESFKVRKVILLFYLEDNTLGINEPKQTNSGTPQGVFLKRRVVEKGDGSGSQILPEDIRVGETLNVYGRNVFVYDCDQYTREFYDNAGWSQLPAQGIPEDNFEKSRKAPVIVKKDQEMKEFLERSLGGGRVSNQKQFLENDRKVLKFYATHEDLPFILHYYLSDDTVEVREVHDPNSGRDPFPLLLKRQKLKKNFTVGQPGGAGESEIIKDNEFQVGMEINIFSRRFQIHGCDPFTQNYYREKYNRTFPLGTVKQPVLKEMKKDTVPAHNGFGDEEDSLGYVYRLVPKQPKKDYFKFVDNANKILRYHLKMITNRPEDVERRFVLGYYLNDDTISIYEVATKNSGIWEGKFLERGKFKNIHRNNERFNPSDLVIGEDIVINCFHFHILGCDGYTEKWINEHFVDDDE